MHWCIRAMLSRASPFFLSFVFLSIVKSRIAYIFLGIALVPFRWSIIALVIYSSMIVLRHLHATHEFFHWIKNHSRNTLRCRIEHIQHMDAIEWDANRTHQELENKNMQNHFNLRSKAFKQKSQRSKAFYAWYSKMMSFQIFNRIPYLLLSI